MPHPHSRKLIFAVLLLVAAACSSPSATSPSRVFFVSPADGATVSSPVHITLGTENFTIEPAGEVKTGAGHLHIMVDTACADPGQVIAKDDQHLHYGQGQLEADLALAPGTHTLCLQAGDGAHTSLNDAGLTQTITITVQ